MSQLKTQMDGELVGSRIRQARKEAGLSISQFAQALSVGERTVTRWQSGVLAPSIPRLYAIAQVLGKPVTFFLEPEEGLRHL